VSVKIGDYSR